MDSTKNPLLTLSTSGPLIDKSYLKAANFDKAFAILYPQCRAEFNKLIRPPYTYESLFEATPSLDRLLMLINLMDHLEATDPIKGIQKVLNKWGPLIYRQLFKMINSRQLHSAYTYYLQTEDYAAQPELKKQMVVKLLTKMEQQGVHLSNYNKRKFSKLQLKLNFLKETFNQNLAISEHHCSITLNNSKIQSDHVYSERDGSLFKLQTLSKDDTLKQEIYLKRRCIGRGQGYSNLQTIEDIIKTSHACAGILGYSSYAAYVASQRSLGSVSAISEFLNQTASSIAPEVASIISDIEAFASSKEWAIEPWNIPFIEKEYFSHIRKQHLDNFDWGNVKLSLSSVLDAFIEHISKIFGLAIEINISEHWRNDCFILKVSSSKQLKGCIYMDLCARPLKQAGSWVQPFNNKHQSLNEVLKPSAFLCCSFESKGSSDLSPLDPNVPMQLSLLEVEILYHELGHALHQVLSEVNNRLFSGIDSVEIDAIELPAVLTENFLYNSNILEQLLLKSKQFSPDKLKTQLEAYLRVRAIEKKLSLWRKVVLSEIDLEMYKWPSLSDSTSLLQAEQLLKKSRQQYSVMDPEHSILPTFSHIFSKDYAVGYYSYIWADILACKIDKLISNVSEEDYLVTMQKIKKLIFESGSVESMFNKIDLLL